MTGKPPDANSDVDHEALAEAPDEKALAAPRTLVTGGPPDVDHEALAEAPDKAERHEGS